MAEAAGTSVAAAPRVSTDSLSALLLSSAKAKSPNSSLDLLNDLADSSSAAHAHLLSLSSQSLSDLRVQPAAHKQAVASLDTQLSTLCARHVSSFVQVHEATSALPDSLDQLDDKLQGIIDTKLPALASAVQSFSSRIERPLADKERARNLMERYDANLKDLLDIPRLIMTCVRANHPIEALQLGSHIARLAAASSAPQHDTDANDKGIGPSQNSRQAVLLALRDESWGHLQRLRQDLLRGLGGRGVRLPAARRYYSLLRRFADLDEAGRVSADDVDEDDRLSLSPSEICLSFLRSRWTLVDEIGSHAGSYGDDPVKTMSDHISTWRDVVGEACSIAIALFSDAKAPGADGATRQRDEASPLSLLSTFALQCLQKLEALVVPLVQQIKAPSPAYPTIEEAYTSLSSVHMQCAYAATSLARHGLDFSFSPAILEAFEEQARRLREQYAQELEAKRGAQEQDVSGSQGSTNRVQSKEEESVQQQDGNSAAEPPI